MIKTDNLYKKYFLTILFYFLASWHLQAACTDRHEGPFDERLHGTESRYSLKEIIGLVGFAIYHMGKKQKKSDANTAKRIVSWQSHKDCNFCSNKIHVDEWK